MPLQSCQWVAIEVCASSAYLASSSFFCGGVIAQAILFSSANIIKDQWNQFGVYQVHSQAYGRPLSSIFADSGCQLYDEENDPTVSFLRYIDYRYLRFFYHQIEDRFCLISGWKDPLWTNAKMMRMGLDADDRDSREQVFGKNLIDIHQKSAFELLLDEVGVSPSPLPPSHWKKFSSLQAFHPFYIFQVASLVLWSLDQYYYYAVCIFTISFFSIGATVFETKTVNVPSPGTISVY